MASGMELRLLVRTVRQNMINHVYEGRSQVIPEVQDPNALYGLKVFLPGSDQWKLETFIFDCDIRKDSGRMVEQLVAERRFNG